jgi:plasmid stabilisation system protein
MKSYAVQITEEALSDMEALYSYIAVRLKAPENAMKQYNRIADAIVSLKQFPDRFAYVELEPEYSMGIHRMLVDHFVVFYVIDNDTVTVTDVLYGASDMHYRWKERHLS